MKRRILQLNLCCRSLLQRRMFLMNIMETEGDYRALPTLFTHSGNVFVNVNIIFSYR